MLLLSHFLSEPFASRISWRGQRGIAWWWVFPLLLATAMAAYWYWSDNAKKNRQRVSQQETAVVQRGNVAVTVLATGQVQAFTEVSAGAQASGQVSELLVKVGDVVSKGQVIAKIDPSTQENELRDVQAQLKSNQASVRSQEALLAQAKRNVQRQEMMYAEGATSLQALEQAQSQLKTSMAGVQQAKVQLEQSRIKVKRARLNMGYTTVLAPIAGTVVSLAVSEGQTLNAVQSSPTIASIAQLDKMKVRVEISEADVGRVQQGQAAYFTVLGDTRRRHEAVVESIDPAPTAISNNANASVASGSPVYYYGTLVVPNDDGALRMYMTANAVITVAEAKNTLLLPVRALYAVDVIKQTAMVQLRSGGQTDAQLDAANAQNSAESNAGIGTEAASGQGQAMVIAKAVTTGLRNGVQVEVLAGLQEGDVVVMPESSAAEEGEGEPGLFD